MLFYSTKCSRWPRPIKAEKCDKEWDKSFFRVGLLRSPECWSWKILANTNLSLWRGPVSKINEDTDWHGQGRKKASAAANFVNVGPDWVSIKRCMDKQMCHVQREQRRLTIKGADAKNTTLWEDVGWSPSAISLQDLKRPSLQGSHQTDWRGAEKFS